MANIDSFQEIIQWIQSPDTGEEILRWIKQHLTDWVLWKDRASLAGFDDQGVYFIAEGQRPNRSDILSPGVVCIGETSRTLADRLDEFNSTAFKGKGLHGPGGRHQEPAIAGFFVAILPLKLDHPWRHVLPPFLEGVAHYYY
jgi:hypothetical protein